jgi:hypothetical protein
VGFHAHASDVKIPFKLVHLIDHIEMLIAALLVKDPFAKHEHTHVVAFVQSDIRKPHCVVNGLPIVCRDNEKNLHRKSLPSKRRVQISDSATVSLSADRIPSSFHDQSLSSSELHPSQMMAKLQTIILSEPLDLPPVFVPVFKLELNPIPNCFVSTEMVES